MRYLIRKLLGITQLEDDVQDLENRVEGLEDLKDTLQAEVLDNRTDLQFIIDFLKEQGSMPRKKLATTLQEELDVSRATAYRKIKELEEDLQFIREEDKQLKAVDFSHS